MSEPMWEVGPKHTEDRLGDDYYNCQCLNRDLNKLSTYWQGFWKRNFLATATDINA